MNSDDNEYPIFGFGIDYAGRLVYCEVTMKESRYEIFFDGIYVAEIQMNDEIEWSLTGGMILPQTIISEIGRRIHSRYS